MKFQLFYGNITRWQAGPFDMGEDMGIVKLKKIKYSTTKEL